MIDFMMILFYATDHPLGKVDRDSFSQQTLMEIFIEGIENKDLITGNPQQEDIISRVSRFFGWFGVFIRVELTLPRRNIFSPLLWVLRLCMNNREDNIFTRITRFLSQCRWMRNEADPEEPIDISEWNELSLNGNGEVVRIHWKEYGLEGTVKIEWLPETVTRIFLSGNNLTGTINLTSLPTPMKCFYVPMNRFTGELDLCHLPEGMRAFSVAFNKLSGTLNFGNLPRDLGKMFLSWNTFSGTIDLTHLPAGLELLGLSKNQLSGSVNLQKLPVGMKSLYIGQNDFFGFTNFSILPQSLENLDVSHTQIEGEINAQIGTVYHVDNSNVKILEFRI